ncbi:MAG: hypothetical protein C0602_11715 [Denitrovibrio sp.]|nr:MAG: hypothetical protein C0602_11715 [Denitrovibrio sp.]
MKLKTILLIITISVSASAGDISDEIIRSDQYLSKVKNMIQQESEIIQTLKNEKVKTANQLKKAEMELKLHKGITKKLEAKLVKTNKEIGTLVFKQQEYSNRQTELKEKIRSANFYLAGAGETDLLEALILSDELTELTAGLQIISRVNTKLFEMVQELSENKIKLQNIKENLSASKKEQEQALKEKKESVKEYSNKKTLIKQLHKIAAEDEKIQKEYVALLKNKQDEMEEKIKELKKTQQTKNIKRRFDGLEKDFSDNTNSLMWPINGKIIEKFGTKKIDGFKGVVHKKGIKIKPNETKVASVYDGVILHTDTAWGLGWFVIVEHFGGYYSLYANLDEIIVTKDQKVHAGEILGTIDIDQGTNTPYLYFEIRIHDKAVDPLGWLSS